MNQFLLFPALLLIILSTVGCLDERSTVEKATAEKVLILGNGQEPKALDPHLVSGVVESNILRALFEGLTIDHPSEDNVALPGAATSWSANSDFTEWTFQLNPLATWSDGVPVTSADFLFAYERILHPDFPSEYADMLYFIKGAEAFNKGEVKHFKDIGVKAPSEFTLIITLKAPTPFLPEITKHFTWLPLPKHKLLEFGELTEPFTAWTFPENLVSNGPFKLKTWKKNHYIEAEQNPYYWDRKNMKLQGIRFIPTKNTNTEARMFLNHQLHATYKIPPDLIPTAKRNYPEETRQELYIGTRFVRANVKREFTSKREVRQALSLALDRESLVKNILQGGQKPAGSVTPPFGTYHPKVKTEFNPEKAKELLALAGYADPASLPEIELLTTDSDLNRRMAEAMQALWRKHLGLRVRIMQREWKSYLELRKNLEFDLMDGAWIGDYLDPTTFLDLWKGTNRNNNTGWHDAGYEALLLQAETIQDPKKRYDKLLEAESLIMDAIPAIPVYHYTTNYFLSPVVKNWEPLLLNNHSYKFVELGAN